MNATEQWESAWSDYVDALSFQDISVEGEDFPYWCGVQARRVQEAAQALRAIDPEFCKAISV